MVILIDLTSLADNLSGIERYAACLAHEMIKSIDHQFILVFKREIPASFRKDAVRKNVSARVIPQCNKLFFNQYLLPSKITKIDADCYLFLAFPVPWLLKKKNMICAIHDAVAWDCPETMTFLSRWYFRISQFLEIKKCRKIITISEFSRERIIQKMKCPPEKIEVIYCGIEEKFKKNYSSENEDDVIREKYGLPKRYILSLSTIEPRKNMKLLVRAYDELRKERKIDIPLVLAGRRGWGKRDITDHVSKETMKEILYTGFIDDEDLASVYGNADLFVFPTLYEGFGMPPLEAMACGTSVLSSDAASMPEILGDSATLFRSNDIDDLKEKLIIAIKRNDSVSDLTVEKSGKIFEEFRWERQASRLLVLLNEIENRHK